MSGATLDLIERFVHLEDGPSATPVEVRDDLWRRVSASERLREGRFVGLARARDPDDLHPSMWERHPAGDELLVMLSGALDLVLDEPAGERTVELRPGGAFIVPRGVWHRFIQREPSDMLFVVRGQGTEHRPVGESRPPEGAGR